MSLNTPGVASQGQFGDGGDEGVYWSGESKLDLRLGMH